MKFFVKAAAVAAALALAACALAACGGNGSAGTDAASAADTTAQPSETKVYAQSTDDGGYDFSAPDFIIEFDDYDGMKNFADAMLAGGCDGKVVKIEGTATRSEMSVKGSVTESNGDGQSIGVTYVIDGIDDIEKYPIDGARIEMAGVIKADENGVRYVSVPITNVRIVG